MEKRIYQYEKLILYIFFIHTLRHLKRQLFISIITSILTEFYHYTYMLHLVTQRKHIWFNTACKKLCFVHGTHQFFSLKYEEGECALHISKYSNCVNLQFTYLYTRKYPCLDCIRHSQRNDHKANTPVNIADSQFNNITLRFYTQ